MHSIEAKIRNTPAGEARANGTIPAVVYGKDVPSTSIAVGVSEFVKIFRVLTKGETLSLTLEKKTYTVRLQEVQRHPVSGAFLHLDFVIA